MLSSLARRVITVLLAQSLFLLACVCSTTSNDRYSAAPNSTGMAATAASTPIISAPNLAVVTGPEPKIRVALTTDVRSAVISTTGHLMNASGGDTTMLALDTSRVRVDARCCRHCRQQTTMRRYRVIVAGAATHDEAEDIENEIEKLTSEDWHTTFDTETKTWGVAVGSKRPREEAEELRARLEAAGFDARYKGQGLTRIKQMHGFESQYNANSGNVTIDVSRPAHCRRARWSLQEPLVRCFARVRRSCLPPTTKRMPRYVSTIVRIADASKSLQTCAAR